MKDDTLSEIRLRAGTFAPWSCDCGKGCSVCDARREVAADGRALLAEVDRLRALLAAPLPEELAEIEARAEAATPLPVGHPEAWRHLGGIAARAATFVVVDVPRLLAGIRAQAAEIVERDADIVYANEETAKARRWLRVARETNELTARDLAAERAQLGHERNANAALRSGLLARDAEIATLRERGDAEHEGTIATLRGEVARVSAERDEALLRLSVANEQIGETRAATGAREREETAMAVRRVMADLAEYRRLDRARKDG